MVGFIDEHIEACERINAAKGSIKFERPDHWKITIIVERPC